jgi:hypothetical protein
MTASNKVINQEGKPVSLFSLRARKRQATGEPFTFDVDGEFFTMKAPADADWRVTAALGTTEGDLRSFMKELLGEDYERFSKIDGVTSDDINALIDAATRHYQGVTRGE